MEVEFAHLVKPEGILTNTELPDFLAPYDMAIGYNTKTKEYDLIKIILDSLFDLC